MANLLKATCIGRLTRDPHSGDDRDEVYTLLSLAVNRKANNEEITEFIDVSVRGKQAETCAEQLSTGDEVYVDGTLTLREFERKDGSIDKVIKIHASSVQFISVKKWSGNGRTDRPDDPPRRNNGARPAGGRSNGSRYGNNRRAA